MDGASLRWSGSPVSQPSDRELVDAVLEATANMSLRERQRATGLTHATFQRWQTDWKYLRKDTRATLITYLRRIGKMPAASDAGALTDGERARLLELVEEMAQILRRAD